MAKYGKKASKKVAKTMRERKRGMLRSGSGKKVTSRKQAIAIGLSQARREGGKVPAKRKSSSKKRTSKKKTTTSRTRKKSTGRKKSTARKSSTRKRR
jgi:hypothetical protein